MSAASTIFSMFTGGPKPDGGGTPNPTGTPNPAAGGANPNPGGNQLDPAGGVRTTNRNPNAPLDADLTDNSGKEEAKNPLDKYSGVWDDSHTRDAQGNVKKTAPAFTIDPKKIQDAANRVDFTSIITPEQRKAIAAGGDEGTAAMFEAMKAVNSNAFAHATMGSAKMIEAALARQMEQFQASLPGLMKKLGAGESLRSKNPAFKHPAAAPILQGLTDQLAAKHPEATTAEIQEMAEDYLTNFASMFAPKEKPAPGQDENGQLLETDWSDYLPSVLR